MPPTNALHDLIHQARKELAGPDGRPVTFEWIAERAQLPTSTVHALATRELHSLNESTRARLSAIAEALGLDPGRLETAAVESMGYPVQVTYAELDEDREVLIGAYDQLDEDQREQVLAFARFLRSQSKP